MIRPSILVQLDKPRHLRYSSNGIIEAEELTGINLLNLDMDAKKLAMPMMRALVFAALWEEDETITPRKAAELADEYFDGGLPALAVKAIEAIGLAFDGGDEKNAKGPKGPKATAESSAAEK